MELGLRVRERRTLETQRTAYVKAQKPSVGPVRSVGCGVREIRLAKLVDATWEASQGDRQRGQDRILGAKWRGEI